MKEDRSSEYILLNTNNFSEDEFRTMWHSEYVIKEIYTFDKIRVHFYDDNFKHAFYESSGRNVGKKSPRHKDILSRQRLSRMMWIKQVLVDNKAKIVMGYDNRKKQYTRDKRVSIVKGNYVVVIQLYGDFKRARFITAYVADNSIQKILKSPNWK